MTRLIGYARSSSSERLLDLQVSQLRTAGCKTIFTDNAGTARIERPGLKKCLKSLKTGDTLMVWRLDRLGRSMPYLASVLTELRQRNIEIKSLHQKNINPPAFRAGSHPVGMKVS